MWTCDILERRWQDTVRRWSAILQLGRTPILKGLPSPKSNVILREKQGLGLHGDGTSILFSLLLEERLVFTLRTSLEDDGDSGQRGRGGFRERAKWSARTWARGPHEKTPAPQL